MEAAEFREEAPDLDGAPLTPLFAGVELPDLSSRTLLVGGVPPPGPHFGLAVAGPRPLLAAGRGRSAALLGGPSAVPPMLPPSLALGAVAGAGRGKAAPQSSAARPEFLRR